MWTIQVDLDPPGVKKRPRFGVISKNSRIKGRYWSREAKSWGEYMQWEVLMALRENRVKTGDADYQIKIEMVKPDRRRMDSQNAVDFISDALEPVLNCDDSRFSISAVAPVVGDDPLIRLTITRTEP